MFEKFAIKKYKERGIDIVVYDSGFKTTYYVYSAAVPEGRRFESFKAVKQFCDELLHP